MNDADFGLTEAGEIDLGEQGGLVEEFVMGRSQKWPEAVAFRDSTLPTRQGLDVQRTAVGPKPSRLAVPLLKTWSTG